MHQRLRDPKRAGEISIGADATPGSPPSPPSWVWQRSSHSAVPSKSPSVVMLVRYLMPKRQVAETNQPQNQAPWYRSGVEPGWGIADSRDRDRRVGPADVCKPRGGLVLRVSQRALQKTGLWKGGAVRCEWKGLPLAAKDWPLEGWRSAM